MRLVAPPTEHPGSIPTRAYRVVFWQQQLPDVDQPQREMGWSALAFDFDEAEDVCEVIEWAENHFDEHTDAVSERGYTLYAYVPDEDWMVHIAGVDPTVPADAPAEANLSRAHPLARS